MNYVFHARLEPDPDGGFLVTFPDVPEAITGGDDEAEAKHNAAEALGLALRGILALGRALPQPAAEGKGLVPIAVDTADALKLALVEAFKSGRHFKVGVRASAGQGRERGAPDPRPR